MNGVLGKAEMKKVPIFGFIYSRGAVFVDRGNSDQRAKSVRNLKSILRKGISIFIILRARSMKPTIR